MKTLVPFSLILAFLFTMSNVVSASPETATMGKDFKIEITNIPATGLFELNTDLVFDSNTQKAKFFELLFENLLSFKTDVTTGAVELHLHVEYLNTPWSVEKWNTFLAEHTEHFENVYNKLRSAIESK